MTYFLGVDVGTTSTKAVVVDEPGTVLAVGSSAYGFDTPRPLWAEQDPDLWWTATQEAIRSAIKQAGSDGSQIASIGLTGQMHGLVLLDAARRPLRPALLWNDQRTEEQCDFMRATVGRERLIEITGNDALTGFSAPKMLWVRRHEPEIYARARHALLPKDYLRLQLTGELATDKAGASGTQLFELADRDWSPELLSALDIDPALLPPTHEGTEITGAVTEAAAKATGLAVGTPVVAGGGDQAANAVGIGVVDPSSMALSLGTSGVVFAATDQPDHDPRGRVHAFCHAVPDRWHMMGVMLSAAGSLRWFRDTLAPGVSFAELSAEAEQAPPGCDGLIFLPYLSGERTPHPDPNARGGFIGLTVRHTRAHLVRAIMEGVAFGLKDGLDLMRTAGLAEVGEIRASGGGTASPLWRQILADILETDIVTVNTTEGAAYGAAMLASVAAEVNDTVSEAAGRWVHVTRTSRPSTADYSAHHRLFAEQYTILKPTFDTQTKLASAES